MRMNPGDVAVSGVKECVVIQDICINVPQGKMITIPGDVALRSKDLWEYISSNRLFRHNPPNFKVPSVPLDAESKSDAADISVSNTNLQSELSRVQSESTKVQLELMDRVARLEVENAQLKVEQSKKSADDDRLKIILERLNSIPTTTVQVANQVQATTVEAEEQRSSEKVPIYIPSVPDAQVISSRIYPKVTRSDGADVEKAGKALREFRKRGG